ncbi:MAG: type II toxin-antitoxin system prevent-host-death family antitoxin [Propionibacteriaceae bacterium]|nr:type II toxin-antitoxin system prevent-host-death family antitoxin [Propionibacteriaceae bacterium]
MSVESIGVRELQKATSAIVRSAQEQGRVFLVTVHGRPTGVAISKAAPAIEGASADKLRAASSAQQKSESLIAAQLAAVTASRDAFGTVGG